MIIDVENGVLYVNWRHDKIHHLTLERHNGDPQRRTAVDLPITTSELRKLSKAIDEHLAELESNELPQVQRGANNV